MEPARATRDAQKDVEGGCVAASWLVGSSHQARRHVGFWVFLLSNALWVLWGLYDGAPALIAMQVALAAMNIRGAMKTDEAA